MREIALDTETTGLSYSHGDRIIEIGCVEIINKELTGNNYHVYINPEREVGKESIEITGLTLNFLRNYSTFKEIYQEFLDFIKDDRLVIHNATFDMGFLNYELNLANNKIQLSKNQVVDTLNLARHKYPGSPATLDALCKKFNVDSRIRTKHGALIDAELLAQVYIIMSVEKVQNSLFENPVNANSEYKNLNHMWPSTSHSIIFGSDVISEQNEINIHYKRLSSRQLTDISEQELEAHKQFLTKITNPIWIEITQSIDQNK